jgi:hypothetical protein
MGRELWGTEWSRRIFGADLEKVVAECRGNSIKKNFIIYSQYYTLWT